MVVKFSELEKQYLLIVKGSWKIKEDCPDKIKKKIEMKFKMLYNNYSEGDHGSQNH